MSESFPDRESAGLSERKQRILRAIILEYVAGAEPIPSDLIASKYELGVRSATIRNEMAEITDLGLLEQRHTSGGRIPSQLGYRYFVDHLARTVNPQAEDKQTVRDTTDENEPLTELLRSTTQTLSRLTHLLSAAATLKNGEMAVRSILLTGLGPKQGLIVLVLENGQAENRFLELPGTPDLDQIGEANDLLAAWALGKNLKQVLKAKPPQGSRPVVNELLARAINVVKAIAKELTKVQVIMEGEEFVLAQPEFRRDTEEMVRLIQALEDEAALAQILTSRDQPDVQIGAEIGQENLRSLTVLRRLFYVGDQEAGTLAIIGPTRLDYEGGQALLDFAAQGVSYTLTRTLRPDMAPELP